MRRTSLVIISLLLCIALSVPALAAGELDAFQRTANDAAAFSDVPAGSWYEAGVQAVYRRGIMTGTGAKTFAPTQTISWAQAITIAARIHAACTGVEISASDGAWYEPNVSYAAKAELLPSTCPEGATVSSRTITRQELAGLFANVLSAQSLPAINDSAIPDLAAVDEEFRSAVRLMYAAGVFTGKNGGKFDPKGSATRAEIAVIVARLLLPGQRIGHDNRVHPVMSSQMGNYIQGSLAIESDSVVYFPFRNDQEPDETRRIGVLARKADGSTETVFTADQIPDNLWLDTDGSFYFLNWEKLLHYSPATNQLKTVYIAKGKIDTFQLYGGKIYLLENYAGDPNFPDQWRYRFGYLENGKFHNLMDGITFDQELYMDKFYLFGGKAYFLFGDNTYVSNGHLFYNYPLWSIDLETGAKGRAVDLDDFYMDEVAFDGATGYALEGGKDLPMSIVRFSLLQPELRETVLVLPDDASDGHRMTLFANGSDLYYFSPEAHRIWKIGKDGAMTLTALAPWGERLYDYATVTSQGTLFHDITTLRLSDSETLTVQLKNGTYVNCSDFLKLQ